MAERPDLPLTQAREATVDVVVVGAGTGLLAALAAERAGLSVLVVEKSPWVGGSTAMSGGAFWIPGNRVLAGQGSDDSTESARTYLEALLPADAPRARWEAYLEHGPGVVDFLAETTRLPLAWAPGYPDYHSELPGASKVGRSVESLPFDLAVLGDELPRLRPAPIDAPVPMPVTSPDYRWLNLVAKAPAKAIPRMIARTVQGGGGLLLGRRYAATGTALAGGLFAATREAGIPIWTEAAVTELVTEGADVTGVIVRQAGREVRVTARRGVILAAGGFDHDPALRRDHQSPSLDPAWPLGATTNTGDLLTQAVGLGADTGYLDQAWWFPAVAPVPGGRPGVLLAERSLPGSFLIDRHGQRFVNEAVDYMSFGQEVMRRERAGDPVGTMWLVFDQIYRDSYVFSAEVFPRMPLPKAWYAAGIAHTAADPVELARAIGVPVEAFLETGRRFNAQAAAGFDDDFGRGAATYDRYYGDPTVQPNPTLRPLTGNPLHAVRVVLSDLGTCGGLRADEYARVLRPDGTAIEGLYAIGNTAANVFASRYPGAGATIGQGLVFGVVAARHAAGRVIRDHAG